MEKEVLTKEPFEVNTLSYQNFIDFKSLRDTKFTKVIKDSDGSAVK